MSRNRKFFTVVTTILVIYTMLTYDASQKKVDTYLMLKKVFDVLAINSAFLMDIKILNIINQPEIDRESFDLNTTFGIYSEYSANFIHQVDFCVYNDHS